MDPEDLYRFAVAAIARGKSPEVVNAKIAEVTGGSFSSIEGLRSHVQQAPNGKPGTAEKGGAEPGEDAALRRFAAHNPVNQFLRAAAQGLTFGFGDEIAGAAAAVAPGGKSYTEARDASRQRVSDMREVAPGATALSEIAGGVALPALGAARVARTLVRPGAGALGKAVGAAGAAGAIGAGGGALYGLGESEAETPGGLLVDAAKSGAVGGLLAAPLGAGASAVGGLLGKAGRFGREVVAPQSAGRSEARRTLRNTFEEAGIDAQDVPGRLNELGPQAVIADLDPSLARLARTARDQAPALEKVDGPVARLGQRHDQTSERLAKSLRETSGISQSMGAARDMADRAVQEVREKFYRPLEEAFPQVEGPNVLAALGNPRVANVAKRTTDSPTPSFTELQDIMMDLRDEASAAAAAGRPNASRRAKEAFDNLRDAMRQDIPGFDEAQSEFMKAAKTVEAFDMGAKLYNKPAREIQEAFESLPPEAHDALRTGLLQRWEEALLSREGASGAASRIMKAGPEGQAQIRALFGSEDGFRQFMQRKGLEDVFSLTWNKLAGGPNTAERLTDGISTAPVSKADIVNRVWNAVFSPGEARRVQAQTLGETLLGNDAQALQQLLQGGGVGQGLLSVGSGLPGATGAVSQTGGVRSLFDMM